MESKEESNVENMQVEIKDALICFICTSRVIDPMMCSHCKRLVCTECIKKWLEIHEQCPFCKAPTTFDEMIALPFMNVLSDFFLKEIDKKNEEKEKEKEENENNENNINNIIEEEDELDDSNKNEKDKENDNLSKSLLFRNKFNFDEDNQNQNDFLNMNYRTQIRKKGEFCPEHRNQLIEYFCLNCNTKHCSKCLLFFNVQSKIHKDHKVINIEEKNKYNIDEIKQNLDDLLDTVKKLKEYDNNITTDMKVIEKKEEFVKVVLDEFTKYYTKKIEKQNKIIDKKTTALNNQLQLINQIRNSYTESLNNFVERDDENGFKDYQKKILGFKDLKKFKYWNSNNIFSKPFLNFYETDFIDIDINEYNDTIGEIKFNIEGLNRELHLKLNGEADDEVLINLLINLEAFGDENERNDKDKYYGYLLIIKDYNVIGIPLDEKMLYDDTIILGRTIIKSGLKTIINEQRKLHAKLILSHFNF